MTRTEGSTSHRFGVFAGSLLALFLGGVPVVTAEPQPPEIVFELRHAPRATPPRPDPGTFSVQLVLDDDQAEGVVGFGGATARQFLWLNRFDEPGPFELEEIWVLFPAGTDAQAGDAIEIVVYSDPDGDPANGADLLASYDVTIQVADGDEFSIYPIAPLAVPPLGDVLIGVVNRYHETGVDPAPTQPASFDTTVSQDRSYLALWPGDPPSPPDLATASDVSLLDGVISGNFMIRGFGRGPAVVVVPTASPVSLLLLVVLLGGVGWRLAIRRRLLR